MSALRCGDYAILKLLDLSPFEQRRTKSGLGWRFGTKKIGDTIVARLIASGRAQRVGDRIERLHPRSPAHPSPPAQICAASAEAGICAHLEAVP